MKSLRITANIPSDQNTSYQFVRNNIPVAIDTDGNLLSSQITNLADNVVDSSRFVCGQWGGNKATTYTVSNKYDAVWLFKSIIVQSQTAIGIAPLNTTADNLLAQNQIFFFATKALGNTGTAN